MRAVARAVRIFAGTAAVVCTCRATRSRDGLPTFLAGLRIDNTLGGTGNWSNGADWSGGEPGSSSDVLH